MKLEYFNKPITSTLFIVISVLICLGLLNLLSASMGGGALSYNSTLFFFNRQVIFCLVGAVFMFFFYKWSDFDKWRWKLSLPLVFLTVVLLIWAAFSPTANDVHRWIYIGSFQFQPGEFAKFSMILFWADFLASYQDKIVQAKQIPLPQNATYESSWMNIFNKEWFRYHRCIALKTLGAIWPALLVSAVVMGLIELGSDLGTNIVIGSTIIMMIIAAGAAWQFIVGSISIASLAGMLMILITPYRLARIYAWLDPMANIRTSGFQASNSFFAIGSGGIWGVGLPFSRQKFDFVPEMHCDFIYAIICEEFGLIGSLALLFLFFVLIMCCIEISLTCTDPYRAFIAFGISLQIIGQTLFNVGVVTGLFPNKGLPMPFMSYGGSSLFVTMISMGLMLNISANNKSGEKPRPVKVKKNKAVREGATLSSSDSQSCVTPMSSIEWEGIASSGSVKQESNLPRPAIDPTLVEETPS
ncbi:MAG: FtsW/RodA/SpoVE family cell cycle protein [Candidatus Bruticola sp.]